MSLLINLVFVALWFRLLSILTTTRVAEFLWQVLSKVSTDEKVLELRATRSRLVEVRQERTATSSKDEFAKWAKLDREYNKLKARMDLLNADVGRSRASLQNYVRTARWLLSSGLKLYLLWKYSSRPVVWLPRNVLPRFVEWVLSFPRAPMGSISASWWLAIVDHGLSAVTELIK